MATPNPKTQALTTKKNTAIAELGSMSVDTIVQRKKKIEEVMHAVMKEGEHYGKVGGMQKPTLMKAGAEVLATVFGLAPTFKITRTDLEGGHREYEIVCTLTQFQTGAVLGEGVGSCSTMESKYRWRKGSRECPECGSTTALFKSKDRPEWFCWKKKNGCGSTFPDNDERITSQNTERVENPDVADTYNTVLKMAKKRAQVDATLTAVGASDILTQDLEDLGPDQRRDDAPAVGPMPSARTSAASSTPAPATKPAEPPPGLAEEEMENLLAAIGGMTSIPELRKLGQERLVPTAKTATGAQYKKLREAFEAQHDLIEDALNQQAQDAAGPQ